MWDSLQNLIPKAAGKYNFRTTLKALEICRQYRSLSASLISASAQQKTRAKSYVEQTLTIAVPNSAWAQQVQINKHKILEAINQKFGANTVTKIKISITENQDSLQEN